MGIPIFGIVVLLIVVFLVVWVVSMYNGLVRLRNEIQNAWAQIDVQLKRRSSLIPNLVETVKGYAGHEKEVFTKVTEARNMAMNAETIEQRAAGENMLIGALKSLFAVAEAYPELKANQNFLALQEELTSTENKVAFARQFFNDTTLRYNNQVETFPSSILANMYHFERKPFFETPDEAERSVPKVQF